MTFFFVLKSFLQNILFISYFKLSLGLTKTDKMNKSKNKTSSIIRTKWGVVKITYTNK